MPLVRNIPEGKVGWKKVKCQICGSECWERPEQKQLLKENNNMIACCTKCAIEKVTIRDGVTIRGG
ncbi:hypothetical protein BBF96_03435 [Anoxybacter fermentans]|uniref:Uncharacterized protein n=2 Tax=Anoxybacter fermentans TaxID=1323375 RepID=A0A3Q9HSW0_9FIRM|nr:hypothetical protein BBF96_03435 [Anoxybacter fermentans]